MVQTSIRVQLNFKLNNIVAKDCFRIIQESFLRWSEIAVYYEIIVYDGVA